MKIKKITHNYSIEPTFDLEVPGVHEFLLEGNLVTHNSSLISNSTNGIEPPRDYISYKRSKSSTIPIIVPFYQKLKKDYTLAFDIGDNKKILNVVGVLSRWLDMSVSTNLYYRYSDYPGEKLPDMVVIKDIFYAYKLGVPALYYSNTSDMTSMDLESCAGGACAI